MTLPGSGAGLTHDPEIEAMFGKDHAQSKVLQRPLRVHEAARRCSLLLLAFFTGVKL
ncbi:hypothetical protein NKH57_10940 [Mesorhizobium sp. M1050]|uniref:hypothetical protein n=1 Tax=unclassified Mesorhizobium TaxID=325217 RepID=UPI0004101DC7|nr:hypothetical protein [Mesorhizobium sp. LNHC252B00]